MTQRPSTETELRAHIANTPVSGSPTEMRAGFARLTGPAPEAAFEEVTRGGIPCTAIGTGPELIWFHGGGYVFGSPGTHAALALGLAQRGLRVVMPDYRLAPEHPWPAMLHDARAVLDGSPACCVGGDSAGGHLALNLALAGSDRIKGLALVSPNTDHSGLSTTRGRDGDAMNDDATDKALSRMAMPETARRGPEASPLLARLEGLPPVHLEAAGAEILLDDTLLLARKAALSNVDTRLHVTPGLFHMFPLWPDALPEAAKALDRVARFVRDLG
ncbi:acetyl esterase/lipase [Sagittula marina]|uniref:Acetyl esterase/lipase n=1 Tax=Sagittula marina TaxID=943940 RepID=A0A7W6GRR9_9RHOB|nr:alpha/beta hydrolase [Sagittula marina]MBB3985007.1 acetyl esterase/lipase [Sagittula marina]